MLTTIPPPLHLICCHYFCLCFALLVNLFAVVIMAILIADVVVAGVDVFVSSLLPNYKKVLHRKIIENNFRNKDSNELQLLGIPEIEFSQVEIISSIKLCFLRELFLS